MSKIISISPNLNIPEALRHIADMVEDGRIETEDCTLIAGLDVFHLGCVDDAVAATNAVFNMTYGIQKLMQPVVDAGLVEP